MFQKEVLKNYLLNPFLIWGLLLAVITTFDAALLSNQIMNLIIIQELYVPILFCMMTFIIIVAVYPLRKGLRELVKRGGRQNVFFGISSGLILLLVAYIDGVFFLSDPFVILATLNPLQGDQETFESTMLLKNFSQFLILPILGAFVHTNIKIKLVKENLEIHGKFKDNIGFVFEVLIINGAMFGVYLIIANF